MITRFLLLLSTIVLFAACRKPGSGEEHLIKVEVEDCASQTFRNEEVILCFDSLIKDSRCPITAICMWPGVAQAKFSFLVDDQKHQLVLSTNKILPGSITDTTIRNYTITLATIDPYPGTGQTITPYAEVRIKKQ